VLLQKLNSDLSMNKSFASGKDGSGVSLDKNVFNRRYGIRKSEDVDGQRASPILVMHNKLEQKRKDILNALQVKLD